MVVLCVLLAFALIFHQGIALKQKKAYNHSIETLPAQQKVLESQKKKNEEIKREWMLWDNARQDIAEIEKDYYYEEDENINQLRLDLRNILRAARIRVVSDMNFDWTDREGEGFNRVGVQFTVAGSYAALKRFIHQVEIHPKFLMIEKIDFRDIDVQSGQVEIRIELAGYYRN